MSRLDFLPDANTLADLCHRVRGQTLTSGPRPAKAHVRTSRTDANFGSLGVPSHNAASSPKPVTAHKQVTAPTEAAAELDAPVLNAKTLPPTQESLLSEMDLRLEDTDSLDKRFSHLVQWLETQASAKAVFITDTEGLAMAESNAREGYMAAAGELGAVIKNLLTVLPDVEEGSTTLQLRSGGNVELLWCETRLGRFAVGLVLDRPLEPFWSQLIPAALQKVLALNV